MKRLALLIVFTSVAAGAFAQTAILSSVNSATMMDPSDNDGVSAVLDASGSSQGAILGTLSSSASSSYSNGGNSGFAFTTATASWLSAGSGSVHTTGGWNFDTRDTGRASMNNAADGSKVWTYQFLATADTTFTLKYNVVGSGNTFGLQAYRFDFDGAGGGALLGLDFAYPDGNGTLTRSLLAGQTYTVSLWDYENIFGAVNGYNGSYDGQFDWSVQTVPEPGSMAALGLGLGAFAKKRRK